MPEPDTIESLDLLDLHSSGFDQLYFSQEQEERFYKPLSLLVHEKHQELSEFFFERPDLIDSSQLKALLLLNCIFENQLVDERLLEAQLPLIHKMIFPLRYNEVLADSIIAEAVDLFQMLTHNLSNFYKYCNLDLYKLKSIFPTVVIYYSDYILKNNLSELYPSCYKEIKSKKNFDDMVDDHWQTQRERLLALYYLKNQDIENSEKHLIRYRKKYKPLSSNYKLIQHSNKLSYPATEVLAHWQELLDEMKEIQHDIYENSLLKTSTCFYYDCNDCCTKDYPVLSLTEYEFFKAKCKAQGIDISRFKKAAQTIQDKHQKLYGDKLKVADYLNRTSLKAEENPHDHKFPCPLIVDGKCGAYEARPFVCRVFGASTIDGNTVQSCNYFLNQYAYNSSHRNEREVYDSRPLTRLVHTSDQALSQAKFGEKKVLKGTLAAWLSDDNFNQ